MTTTAAPALDLTQTTPDAAQQHSAAEYQALLAMVAGLGPKDWSAQTDCTAWKVRDLLAHVAGAAEEAGRRRTFVRHQVGAVIGQSRGAGATVDLLSAAQIADRTGLSDAELAADLRRWAASAPAGRRGQPAALRRLAAPKAAGLRPGATLAYLMDVIYTRDIWLHRVDLHRATGVELAFSPAEPEVVAQVVRDLALQWTGPAVALTLTGRVAGSWVIGFGDPVASVTEDAVSYLRLLSGRTDECTLEAQGDRSVADRLRTARVVF